MTDENWKEMFYNFWKIQGNTFVQFLLDAGLDLNTLNKYGRTMLSYSAEWGNLVITDLLIHKGADGNIPNSNGSIPLHIASQFGHKDIVQYFLMRGISADSCDNAKCTPLHYAAQSSIPSAEREHYQEIVRFLVDSKANLNAVNGKGRTPLLIAAYYCRKDIVEQLIKLGANVDCLDNDRWTVLHHSCWNGWLGIVHSLVEGKDLNARTSMGYTPSILASRRLNKDIVELLIKSGADIDSCDEDLWTVLHYSCAKGWLEIVKYLVNTECDLNVKDSKGCTPLLLAAENYKRGVVQLLIESGAQLECCGKDGRRIVHYACSFGWLDVLKPLIKKNCHLNAQTEKGDTPLHYAVGIRETEIIEHLLKAGADWNIKNNSGKTAFSKCFQNPVLYLEGIILFIEYGAYFQSGDYNVVMMEPPSLKKQILQDVKICTLAVINQVNNAELRKIYEVPRLSRWPSFERLKIGISGDVAQDIAEIVNYEIQTKGYCDILNVRPIVLSCLCIRSLVNYLKVVSTI